MKQLLPRALYLQTEIIFMSLSMFHQARNCVFSQLAAKPTPASSFLPYFSILSKFLAFWPRLQVSGLLGVDTACFIKCQIRSVWITYIVFFNHFELSLAARIIWSLLLTACGTVRRRGRKPAQPFEFTVALVKTKGRGVSHSRLCVQLFGLKQLWA